MCIEILNAYEEITNEKDFKTPNSERKWIKKKFHEMDESHLYPIRGRFNATHRAICRVAKFEKLYGNLYGIELIYAIDNEISKIVNDSNLY